MLKNKKVKLNTKNQLELAKSFFNAILKGKPMPLIHFKNINGLFKQLDADKTLSDLDKKRILSFIIKHNEKQLEERKIQLEVLKIENKKKNNKTQFHNWDGGFQHKHSFSEFSNLRKQVNVALVQKNKAQTNYDTGLREQRAAIDFYNACSSWCKSRGNAHKSTMNWWASTGMPRRISALKSSKEKYTKLSAQLRTWEKEDERFVKKQKEDAKEAREKAERLAAQEKHEAELKAKAQELQKLKIEAAKQAAEIAKVEEEEKKAKAEKEKAEAEKNKINGSKNFGANITNNITAKENKTAYIVIGSTLLLAIIGGSIAIFKTK